MFCKYLAHMDCTATTLARYCNYHTLFFIVKKTSAKVVIIYLINARKTLLYLPYP